jgi:hypothetical protein
MATGGVIATGGVPTTGGVTVIGGGTTTGAVSDTGGATATGGGTATAGATATAGVITTAGVATTGGVIATGGAATGGVSATAGVTATGGVSARGGATATGGVSATGGATATGGVSATGGSTHADAGVACPQPGTLIATNSGMTAWLIDQVANPTLTFCRGSTYTFSVNAPGHPFYIKTVNSTGTANAYSTGVTGNGTQSGDVTFAVPSSAPDTLFYNCSLHAPMNGTIHIVN